MSDERCVEKENIVSCDMIRYKCATCGNTCLKKNEPNNSICGGCNKPNWKIVKNQEAYMINQQDWTHPFGEI